MSRASMLADAADLALSGAYAERREKEPGWHDRAAEFLFDLTLRPIRERVLDPARSLRQVLDQCARHEREMGRLADAGLKACASSLRVRLRREGFAPSLVGECFALVREAASRTIGQQHYDVQLMGGWALLQGKLVEMETGEGKSLVATLPACAMALAGYPVHVITVNDYLAARDSEQFGALYRFLGLSAGAVIQGLSRAARREAYAQSITYCTNKELAFDYLRDRVALARRSSSLHLALEKLHGGVARESELVLRGLYFGIVDEADSVFIDEARTPLILSASTESTEEREQCELALQFARRLVAGDHYSVDFAERSITLTAPGRAKLAEQAHDRGGVWASARVREALVDQALSAMILFHRDQHYVVSEGKVQIVDESTGRVMPDRSWEGGLHQMVEVKEGCALTERRETLARLTYQRLFRRYVRLAGMTGTGKEVAREIRRVYRLDVVRIPLHRQSRRVYRAGTVSVTAAEKWRAVAEAVQRTAIEGGRPVLIGTRSVHASEEISNVLTRLGLAHTLLNAKQDQAEAEIVAQAGQPGQVTVATNMAGRGTDIRLGDGVADRGGLHVILTEYHDSRRIDRQLFGRAARQGDPGSCEAIVSLEDEIFAVYAPVAARLVKRLLVSGTPVPEWVFQLLRRLAQFSAERRSAYVRLENLKLDRRLDQMLAFSGKGE